MKSYIKASGFGALYVAFIALGAMLAFFLVNISVSDDWLEGIYGLLINAIIGLIIPLVSAVIVFIGTVSGNIKAYFVKLLGVICGVIACVVAGLVYCNYIAPPETEGSLGEGFLAAVIVICCLRWSIVGVIVSGVVSAIKQIKGKKTE